MPEASRLLLTADEACAAMKVCRKTLYSLTVPRGTLRSVLIGRSVRYSVETVRAWIADREQA
jgi:excisionase family DNA binding protein